MSLWSRIRNVLSGDRLSREIEEEFQSHMAEGIEQGRDPDEVRRSFGPALQQREASRDAHVLPWLDSLRADAVFGWRQIVKRKMTSTAAILSLALAMGACISAFRLIDALLLRPLPVGHPEELYSLARQGIDFNGKAASFDGWAYPDFELMRTAARGQADLIAVSYMQSMDVTYGTDQEIEKAHLQFVSGSMFSSFDLQPTIGRLFTEKDDLIPGGHPYAVISYDYWASRFARDPKIVGRTFLMGDAVYEIVGVGPQRFTGTETGTVTDIFVPSMMHPAVTRDDNTWHRTIARVHAGVEIEPLRAKLNATSRAFEENRAKGFIGMTRKTIDAFLNQRVVLEPASSGVSGLQNDYRRSLVALCFLVALVLLIACANVANLMGGQAASRGREMALRVSIGAGRGRLVQLVLVESAILALLSSAVGALFAWWAAPFVVSRINPPDNPARLYLPLDWRLFAFGTALALAVTLLFGLLPALRASGLKPASVLKGGDDPHSRRRTMHFMVAMQVAFSFVVLFAAGLFIATFDRVSKQSTGFSTDRLFTLDTVAPVAQSPTFWQQAAEQLRQVPGVERVALAGWPLLGGNAWNGFISVNGAPPNEILALFLNVSPGWLATMRITLLKGRDFRPGEMAPGLAMVNQAFVRQYFHGENPVGRSFARASVGPTVQVVGVVNDVAYRDIHESPPPQAYFPFASTGAGENPYRSDKRVSWCALHVLTRWL